MTLRIDDLFWLAGIILMMTALMTCADARHPRRWSTGLFWAVFAMIFLIGDRMPPAVAGAAAVLMAVLAGLGGVASGRHDEPHAEVRRANARRLRYWLFLPALTIPVVTVIGTVFLKDIKLGGEALLDPKNPTFVSLGVGCIVALGLACWLTRESPAQALRESRRLTESLGWALALPQMLAMLGLVFADAGVDKAVAWLSMASINMDDRLVAVAVYCVGMAVFTVILGNGFAAFPIVTGGVGVPILIGVHHANPAVMAAIGMFCGYCGTLMTPMAANYNLVPAALLELSDRNAVIKAQVPTALSVLGVNIALLYGLMRW